MNQALSEKGRWTIADIDLLAADEWKRYEIITENAARRNSSPTLPGFECLMQKFVK